MKHHLVLSQVENKTEIQNNFELRWIFEETGELSYKNLLLHYPRQTPERIYDIHSLVTRISQIYKGKSH